MIATRIAKVVFCGVVAGMALQVLAQQVSPTHDGGAAGTPAHAPSGWGESSVMYSPLLPITHQTPTATQGGGPHDQALSYVRVRTAVLHPQPNLSHATAEYEATMPTYSDEDRRIATALNSPVPAAGFRTDQSSLHDVAAALEGLMHVHVRLDAKALEDAGLDVAEPLISGSSPRGTLRQALRGQLGTVDMDYIIEHGSLLLTTRDAAAEHCIPAIYPLPTDCNPLALREMIPRAVRPTSWSDVGGNGVIEFLPNANALWVSQTQEVHDELLSFIRGTFDTDLQTSVGNEARLQQKAVRIHPIHDPKTLRELEASLVGSCNAMLGANGDPSAKAVAVGGRLLVQSSSRPFQVYATEMIRAIEGVEAVTSESFPRLTNGSLTGPSPFPIGGGMCWVAREVYGATNPRWLDVRRWMLEEAPEWLRNGYALHGQAVAKWLHDRPVAKSCVHAAMELAVSRD